MNEQEALLDRLDAVTSVISAELQAQLLPELKTVVDQKGIEVTFEQAMTGAQRAFIHFQNEQAAYEYFNGVIRGEEEVGEISMPTGQTDSLGRPIVAKVPLGDILCNELDDQSRGQLMNGLFGSINNYYARRMMKWVQAMAVFSAIAAAKMPSTK